jgi:hypothetical protein
MTTSLQIFDFSTNSDMTNWRIVDDVVMGGRSDGKFYLSPEGHGVFEGDVSLENNGGFSSVRYRSGMIDVSNFHTLKIRLKGDGKRYQFRTKSTMKDYYSYIAYFSTTGDWQTVEIPLSEMYPSYRGRKMNMPNYPGQTLEEIAILISNKKAEHFRLEIDWIELW